MWRTLASVALAMVILVPRPGAAQQKSDEREIAEAVSALPEVMRAGAEVRAFRDESLVMVRAGTNDMICLGDDPAKEGWHVACYHKDLEPFMARGRELRAQGITERPEIDAARLADIESGAIKFPEQSTSLYSLFAPEGTFDPGSGEAEGAGGLWVVYMPYATEESSGFTTEASRQYPWLMFPGTPWAHVMIPRRAAGVKAKDESTN